MQIIFLLGSFYLNDEFLHDYRSKTQNQYERPEIKTKNFDITTEVPERITIRSPPPFSAEEKSIFQTKLRTSYLSQESQIIDRGVNKVLDGTLSPE